MSMRSVSIGSVRSRTWICTGVFLLLCAAAWPSYRWWSRHRESSFRADCTAAVDSKSWDQLEQLATRWLTWDRTNGYAWLFLAEASLQQGDLSRAAECLSRLSDDDPKCLAALIERADLLFGKVNRPLDAVATCERILRIDARVAKAYERLIYFYSMSLQRRKLVKLIRKSIEHRREPPQGYVFLVVAGVLKFSNGLLTVDRWLKQNPDHEPFLVAKAYYVATMDESRVVFEPTEASTGERPLMEQCFERFPRNLEVLAFQLERSIDAGNVDRVAVLLSDLPADAERDSRFWRFAGWLHSARDELEEAERAYRRALEQDVYDWRSRHELADVLRRLGKSGEVDTLGRLAAKGKILERELLELPRASQASRELLARLAEYALECGDRQVADGIRQRISPILP